MFIKFKEKYTNNKSIKKPLLRFSSNIGHFRKSNRQIQKLKVERAFKTSFGQQLIQRTILLLLLNYTTTHVLRLDYDGCSRCDND